MIPLAVWKNFSSNFKLFVLALKLEVGDDEIDMTTLVKAIRYYLPSKKPLLQRIGELENLKIIVRKNGKIFCNDAPLLTEVVTKKPPMEGNYSKIYNALKESKATSFKELIDEISEKTGIIKNNVYAYLRTLIWSGEVKPTINGLIAEPWDVSKLEIENRRW